MISIGVNVGAAVFSLTGPAASYTGGSAFLAFMLAAVTIVFMLLPYIIAGTVYPRHGLSYALTQDAFGRKASGFWFYLFFIGKVGIIGNCTSFAVYFTSVFTTLNPNMVGAAVAIIFFITNYFGLKSVAKVQKFLNFILLIAFISFIAFGFVHMDTMLVFNKENFMTHGVPGLISAVSLVIFSLAGGLSALELGNEVENPERNLPIAVITATIVGSLLFAGIALSTVGSIPMVSQTEGGFEMAGTLFYGGPAKAVMNAAASIFETMKPMQYFFILGGASLAVATTINGCYPLYVAPFERACRDGWFPKWFAVKNKYGVMDRAMFIFLLFALIPLILLKPQEISALNTNIMKVNTNLYILSMLLPNFGLLAYPKKYPQIWEKSRWHMNSVALKLVVFLPVALLCYIWWNNFKNLVGGYKIAVVIALAVGILYSVIGNMTFAKPKE